MSGEVVHERPAQRFLLRVDGEMCVLEYRLAAGVMTITHTGVPEPVRGRGIAARLADAALRTAREEGWKVVPACSYVAAFVTKHPEYADLTA